MKIYSNCLDIPIGTIFYICDPRTPRMNKAIIDNKDRICESIWSNLIPIIPNLEVLNEFRFTIYSYNYSKLYEEFLGIDLQEIETINLACHNYQKPLFLWRCPHANQSQFSLTQFYPLSCKKEPIPGLTGIIYNDGSDLPDEEDYIQREVDLILERLFDCIYITLKEYNGFTDQDYLSKEFENQKLYPLDIKIEMLKAMWKGENEILMFKNYDSYNSYNTLFPKLMAFSGINYNEGPYRYADTLNYERVNSSLIISTNELIDKIIKIAIDNDKYKSFSIRNDYANFDKEYNLGCIMSFSEYKKKSNKLNDVKEEIISVVEQDIPSKDRQPSQDLDENQDKVVLFINVVKKIFDLASKKNNTILSNNTRGKSVEYKYYVNYDEIKRFLDSLCYLSKNDINTYIDNKDPISMNIIGPFIGYLFDKKKFQCLEMTKRHFAEAVIEQYNEVDNILKNVRVKSLGVQMSNLENINNAVDLKKAIEMLLK